MVKSGCFTITYFSLRSSWGNKPLKSFSFLCVLSWVIFLTAFFIVWWSLQNSFNIFKVDIPSLNNIFSASTSFYTLLFTYVSVVVYLAFCLDVVQGRINGSPNENRTQSWRFASLASKPLHHPGRYLSLPPTRQDLTQGQWPESRPIVEVREGRGRARAETRTLLDFADHRLT